jgi:lipoprotein-anchoring transpeptidase ErfK/SrfK
LDLLADPAPVLVSYVITETDVAGPFTPEIPEEIAAQAGLPALGYRNALEALGERFHSAPALLERLNPGRRFQAGETIQVPDVGSRRVGPSTRVTVTVSKGTGTLMVSDDSNIIFSAPVTSGSTHDPLPLGRWSVKGVAKNPPFHYNPELFWDASPGDEKTTIAAGPNNPVGVVWIDLTKPHYGIHGTPRPDQVGHTASHGCVRLTNWDAATLADLVRPGTTVIFTE